MLSSTKMYKKGPTHRVEVFFQAGILAIAAVLLFWALTEKDLWQDEAATAVLATRLLKFGRPVAYDGKNLLTIDMQDDDDDASLSKRTKDPQSAIKYFVGEKNFKEDTTWKWQPWGLFAIAAVSIKLLGQTTLAARLPFALAGLATVLFLYRLARRNLENFLTAALASALLVGNVFWILHARQCRYYSVSSLFLVLTLLAYGRWQWGGRGPAAFIAAAWCWFQVDYGTVLPVLVVLFAEAWLADERGWRPTVITGAILAATLLPFVFFYDLRHRGSDPDGTWFGRFNQNLFNTNEYVIPLFIVLAAVFLLATNWKSLAIAERRLLSVACGTLVALSLWIPTVTVYSFLRYIIIAVPVAALVTAWVVARVCQWRWYLAWPAAAILLTTPWLSVPLRAVVPPPDWWEGGTAYRSEWKGLGDQLFGHPPDPNRLVIDWLRKNAAPTDEILIDYEDFPLMYYLPNPIRGGIATFRVEDDSKAPPRFIVLRRSVAFVHWPVFYREIGRYHWLAVPLKAPDVMWGNNPDPMGMDDPRKAPNLLLARRLDDKKK